MVLGVQEFPKIVTAPSNAQCLLACSNDSVCNVYTFDGLTSTCTLYDAPGTVGGTVSTSPNPYADYGTFTGNC